MWVSLHALIHFEEKPFLDLSVCSIVPSAADGYRQGHFPFSFAESVLPGWSSQAFPTAERARSARCGTTLSTSAPFQPLVARCLSCCPCHTPMTPSAHCRSSCRNMSCDCRTRRSYNCRHCSSHFSDARQVHSTGQRLRQRRRQGGRVG